MGVAWRARPAQGFRGVRSAAAELSLSGPVRSGHQEPVRGRAAPAVGLCTAPVTATAAALHRAGLQTAGPGEALPGHRPAAPGFHTHSLIKLCYQPVCPCPVRGHILPRAHSPTRGLGMYPLQPPGGRCFHVKTRAKTLSNLGRYTQPHTVPSDPEQVGGSGVSCLPGPSSRRLEEPEVTAGLQGPGCECGWAR